MPQKYITDREEGMDRSCCCWRSSCVQVKVEVGRHSFRKDDVHSVLRINVFGLPKRQFRVDETPNKLYTPKRGSAWTASQKSSDTFPTQNTPGELTVQTYD